MYRLRFPQMEMALMIPIVYQAPCQQEQSMLYMIVGEMNCFGELQQNVGIQMDLDKRLLKEPIPCEPSQNFCPTNCTLMNSPFSCYLKWSLSLKALIIDLEVTCIGQLQGREQPVG